MASFYFRYGAMNSGKSAHLMQVAHNYEERDMLVILVKPKLDIKGEDEIISRTGLHRKVDYLIEDNKSFKEYLNTLTKDVKCILVDEAQFLDKEVIDTLYEYNKKYDVPVMCYGLKNDFRTMSFPATIRLFELADILEELVTICKCGRKAKFNARIVNDEFVIHGEQIMVDDGYNVSYDSLCGKCYLEKVLKIDMNKEKEDEEIKESV